MENQHQTVNLTFEYFITDKTIKNLWNEVEIVFFYLFSEKKTMKIDDICLIVARKQDSTFQA